MFYKFTLTGEYEDWGRGLSQPENVYVFADNSFALRPDGVLSEVQNSTVVITPVDDADLDDFKAENQIAADWTPSAVGVED